MENKKIVMGSDHAGLQLKLKVKAHLEARGFEVLDIGTKNSKYKYLFQYNRARLVRHQ